MNSLNHAVTRTFDTLLAPLDGIGPKTALIVVSAVFGVLALVAFKYISWQKGIRAVKDRIKGHMIAIRIYQDDLKVVFTSVLKVLGRNLQYLALNFGPFLPLLIPFVLVTAQLVVRYAYSPLRVQAADAVLKPGQGTMIAVELAPGHEQEIAGLRVELPPGVRALSPLVRAPSEGRAFLEVSVVQPGEHAIGFTLDGGAREQKLVAAGDVRPRTMQPRRVSNRDWWRIQEPDRWPLLWPAEAAFDSSSPFRTIAIAYPARDLGWIPGGEGGILIAFVLASMLFGFLAVKPLGVQI